MKVDIRDLSSVRKEMSLEIPSDQVAAAFRRAVGRVGRKVRIPGFRRGKAPEWVIRQRYGDELRAEVEEDLTQRSVEAAFAERSIEPLVRPVLRESHLQEGEPFRLKVLYEVRPEIEPHDYEGQEVARPAVEVDTEEVQNELRALQQAAAYLVPVEGRGAEEEDTAVVDLEGIDPVSGETLRHEGLTLVAGHERNLPEFNKAVLGRRPGEESVFEVAYPKDYHAKNLGGKTVRYTMTVRELKHRELPDLDDAFAQDHGDFENLAALREEVRRRITARKEAEADGVARNRLLEKLANSHEFEVPEAMVESQLDGRLQDMIHSLLAQGVDPRREEIDWQKIRTEQRPGAVAAVKQLLLLDAIARKEGLQITDEDVDEQIRKVAAARGEKPEVYRNRLRKEGKLQAFKNQLLREKCLDFVYAAAKIS